MVQLESIGDIDDVLNLRLVNKAWRDAFKEYPAAHTYSITAKQLAELCALPFNLTSVDVTSLQGHNFKLSPLSTACSLTSLSLHGKSFYAKGGDCMEPLAKLNKLPPSLKTLTLEAVDTDSAHYSDLAFTGLTCLSLHYQCQSGKAEQVLKLLQHLPKLKVICFTHPP